MDAQIIMLQGWWDYSGDPKFRNKSAQLFLKLVSKEIQALPAPNIMNQN